MIWEQIIRIVLFPSVSVFTSFLSYIPTVQPKDGSSKIFWQRNTGTFDLKLLFLSVTVVHNNQLADA